MRQSFWRATIRREWPKLRLGVHRGLVYALFSGACFGAWALGIWLVGSFVVYGDARARERLGSEVTPVTSPRLSRAYAFDDLPRAVGGSVSCPEVQLVDYGGITSQFSPAARVALPFRDRLVELERVLGEVSTRFYGRVPSAVLVAASYDCRPVTRNRKRLSEHALGNAIDIAGFRFGADPATGAPAYEVRVDRHWRARGDALTVRHARFLDALTRELIARDVFRTLLGPAHPDHSDHFHFDMAPHHYVHL